MLARACSARKHNEATAWEKHRPLSVITPTEIQSLTQVQASARYTQMHYKPRLVRRAASFACCMASKRIWERVIPARSPLFGEGETRRMMASFWICGSATPHDYHIDRSCKRARSCVPHMQLSRWVARFAERFKRKRQLSGNLRTTLASWLCALFAGPCKRPLRSSPLCS